MYVYNLRCSIKSTVSKYFDPSNQSYYNDNQQTPDDYATKNEIRNWIEGITLFPTLFAKSHNKKIVSQNSALIIRVILLAQPRMALARINPMLIFVSLLTMIRYDFF